jgi:hypothetical protein
LAIPACDCIAGLINRRLNSNRHLAYTSGFPSWFKTTTGIRSTLLNYLDIPGGHTLVGWLCRSQKDAPWGRHFGHAVMPVYAEPLFMICVLNCMSVSMGV